MDTSIWMNGEVDVCGNTGNKGPDCYPKLHSGLSARERSEANMTYTPRREAEDSASIWCPFSLY